MRFPPAQSILIAAAVWFPYAAQGQTGLSPPPGDPVRAEAPARPVEYRSPFATYRPHAVVTPGPWRALNDEVARIGGWKAYAREAHEGAQAPAAMKPADTSKASTGNAPR